jgi:hypothetical protein
MRVKVHVKKETPSKNLLNLNKYRLEDYYGKKAVALDISYLEIGKRYTFSTNCPFIRFCKIGINIGSANSVHYYGDPIKKWSFTMARSPSTPTGTLYLYLGRNWNDVNTVEDFKPYFWQIEEGSTATEYEPYGNYQRVKVWNGKKSKNLFNGELKKGHYQDSIYLLVDTTSKLYRSIQFFAKAGTYTFSFDVSINVVREIIDGIYKGYSNFVNVKSFTITTSTDGIIGISFRSTDKTAWDDASLIQIEKGTKATEYEPYNQARMKVHIKE